MQNLPKLITAENREILPNVHYGTVEFDGKHNGKSSTLGIRQIDNN